MFMSALAYKYSTRYLAKRTIQTRNHSDLTLDHTKASCIFLYIPYLGKHYHQDVRANRDVNQVWMQESVRLQKLREQEGV